MKKNIFVLFFLFLNFLIHGENEMQDLKTILYGTENSIPNHSYLIWEYTASVSDYNYTKLQFQPDSIVFFYYIRSYTDKSYTVMEGNGTFVAVNNILKISFEVFSTVQNNTVENKRNIIEEKDIEIELETELYDDGMFIKQINGKKIFAEDDGNISFDFKKNWNYSLEQ